MRRIFFYFFIFIYQKYFLLHVFYSLKENLNLIQSHVFEIFPITLIVEPREYKKK